MGVVGDIARTGSTEKPEHSVVLVMWVVGDL